MKRIQIPNALPTSIVTLGEKFGTSLTLEGARRITHIEASGGSYKRDGEKRKKPHYFVDIWMLLPNGETRILRSTRKNLTARQARDLQRSATRKIAVFLFENKDVQIQPLQYVRNAPEGRLVDA